MCRTQRPTAGVAAVAACCCVWVVMVCSRGVLESDMHACVRTHACLLLVLVLVLVCCCSPDDAAGERVGTWCVPSHRAVCVRRFRGSGEILDLCGNDPSAGSPTETLLRLHLPLNDKV